MQETRGRSLASSGYAVKIKKERATVKQGK